MTDAAQRHVETHLKNRGHGLGVRLGVRTTGCSGLSYTLEFVDAADMVDFVFLCNTVEVVVDPKSIIYLDGTELDYVREGLNEGFLFRNPNVDAECGCGESFTV